MPRPLSNSYVAVHQRVAAQRGSASNYECVAPGCAKKATHWAWQLSGPFREAEPTPQLAARKWGIEVEDYAPMCRPHAARLDMGGTLTHCPAGHERTEANTYVRPNGSEECRPCKSQEQRDRKARKVRKTCAACGDSFAEAHLTKHIRVMHPQEGK